MSEGGAIILLLGLFSVGAFMFGWVVCMFNGYYEYKLDKIKKQECEHEHFYREDTWTEVIYDSDLDKSKTVYKFSCTNCGLVKYKSVIEEKDS